MPRVRTGPSAFTLALACVALVALAPRSSAQAPDAGPPPREGTIGACTVTIEHGAFWRSAQMVTQPGMPHDGFGWMNVSIDARISCTSDAVVSVAGAWTLTGGRRRALHHPDHVLQRVMSEWDGHVTAGTPLEVEWLWHDGPAAGRDAEVGAVVRFRTSTSRGHTLELFVPPGSVAFVS